MTEEELILQLVRVVGTLTAAGERPVLVGGLATLLHVRGQGDVDPSMAAHEPANLARLPLATSDIDLGLVTADDLPSERVRQALLSLGLAATRDAWRFEGVDLLPCADSTSAAQVRGMQRLPLPSGGSVSMTVAGVAIEIADRGSLVLLKAIAWRDRYEEKDLADIALLALGDRLSDRRARAFFAGLDGDTRFLHRRDLGAVYAAFGSRDGRGSRAFARSLLKRVTTVGSTESDVDALEDHLAATAADAVRLLLSDFEDDA